MGQDLIQQLIELVPRMRRFAYGLSGRRDLGDDLVQTACERLLKHQDRLRPDTRLDSWMYRVIRNQYLDGLRSTTVREHGVRQLHREAELSAGGVDTLGGQMALYEVQQGMESLSEEHRSVLMLVCVEGLSYKETAEILQVPMGTVTSRLVRARKALIGHMGEESVRLELEALG